MRTSSLWILGAVATAIALPSVGAFAQDDDLAPIDKIVVTARKKEESLQDTPLAVTAITGDAIEALGIENVDDIGALAPNLYMTQTPGSSANIAVSIRGVGAAEPLLTRDTGIAIYVDDAYIARTAGAAFDLVDLERVEILRGPQGTLYGRNATGGAIKFISRKPSDEFGFKQTFSFGRFSQFHSRTTVDTGEIIDGVRSTLTFLYKERDGYVDNSVASDEDDPGAYETLGIRAAVQWDPTEDLSVSYAFDYIDIDGAPPVFQLFGINSASATALANAGVTSPLKMGDDRFENVSLDFDGRSEWEIMGHNLTVAWEIGDFTIRSISTYRDWENDELGTDLDGNNGITIGEGPCPIFGICAVTDVTAIANFVAPGLITAPVGPFNLFSATNVREQDQFSQEIQFLGNITESIDFVAGVYYFQEDFREDNLQQFLAPIPSAQALLPPGSFVFFVGDGVVGSAIPFTYDGEAESIAVFGSLNWAITDELSTSVGIRWSKDEKEFELTSGVGAKGDDDWSNVDWHFDLGYAVTEDTNVYFRAASAFKSGGFNPRSGAAASLAFDEETLINYEFGVKSLLFDGRLQLNSAVFYSDYEDLQTDQFQAGTGGASSITVNAGQATIAGFELELLAAPTDGITLYLNYGYQDMEYDEYEIRDPGTGMIVDIADDAIFAYRPKNSLSTGAEYRMPVGDGMELSFRIDSRYLDDLTWHATPGATPSGFPLTPFSAGSAGFPSLEEDGYVLVDIRATLSEIKVGNRMTARVSAWGRNVFDEEYIVSGIDFGSLGFGGARWGEPATWGVDVTFEY